MTSIRLLEDYDHILLTAVAYGMHMPYSNVACPNFSYKTYNFKKMKCKFSQEKINKSERLRGNI